MELWQYFKRVWGLGLYSPQKNGSKAYGLSGVQGQSPWPYNESSSKPLAHMGARQIRPIRRQPRQSYRRFATIPIFASIAKTESGPAKCPAPIATKTVFFPPSIAAIRAANRLFRCVKITS